MVECQLNTGGQTLNTVGLDDDSRAAVEPPGDVGNACRNDSTAGSHCVDQAGRQLALARPIRAPEARRSPSLEPIRRARPPAHRAREFEPTGVACRDASSERVIGPQADDFEFCCWVANAFPGSNEQINPLMSADAAAEQYHRGAFWRDAPLRTARAPGSAAATFRHSAAEGMNY